MTFTSHLEEMSRQEIANYLAKTPKPVIAAWESNQDRSYQSLDNDKKTVKLHLSGFVGGRINNDDIQQVLLRNPRSPVEFNLNSPGGFVDEGVSIYHTFAQHPAQVTGIVTGVAGSAAQFLLMSANRVYMRTGTMQYLHLPWTIRLGNYLTFETEAGNLRKASQNIVDLIRGYADRDPNKIWEWMNGEDGADGTFFTAQEAVDEGLADGVLSDKKGSKPPRKQDDSKAELRQAVAEAVLAGAKAVKEQRLAA